MWVKKYCAWNRLPLILIEIGFIIRIFQCPTDEHFLIGFYNETAA